MQNQTQISAQLSLRQQAEEASAELPALKAAAERAVSSMLHGDHNLKRPGLGERFWQFREYNESDRPQDIDWRQSAKSDHVYTREKEKQNSQSVYFWCARDSGMRYTSSAKVMSKLEAAQIICLSISLLLSKAGEQIGRFGSLKTGRSMKAVDRIGEYLCIENKNQTLPDTAGFKVPQNSFLFQCGDFLNEISEIENNFEHISARTNNGFVLQILDPAELELPFDGRIIFEDGRAHDDVAIENVASVREAYTARIEVHNEALKQTALHQGWGYCLHRTDQPIEETLAQIWRHMSQSLESKTGGGVNVTE